MVKTNLQKWIAYMKKTSPLPEITEQDKNKVLVVDSNGKPTWGIVAEGGIPLGENEAIGIFKD